MSATVRVVIKVEDALRWIAVDGNIWYRIVPQAAQRSADFATVLNRVHTPRDTGRLQDSFGVIVEESGRRLRCFWEAPYARFVDQGVPGGPGRYVPYIGEKGKRLVQPSGTNPRIGEWPGFEGRRFIDKIADDLREFMIDSLAIEVERRWIR